MEKHPRVYQESAIVSDVRRLAAEGLTQAQIAVQLNRSRERIRQIVTKYGIATYRKRHCCKGCGRPMTTEESSGAQRRYHLQCKRVPAVEQWFRLKCHTCQQMFRINLHDMKARSRRPRGGKGEKLWFCGKRCQGTHIGKTYGFAVNGGAQKGVRIRNARAAQRRADIIREWESGNYPSVAEYARQSGRGYTIVAMTLVGRSPLVQQAELGRTP